MGKGRRGIIRELRRIRKWIKRPFSGWFHWVVCQPAHTCGWWCHVERSLSYMVFEPLSLVSSSSLNNFSFCKCSWLIYIIVHCMSLDPKNTTLSFDWFKLFQCTWSFLQCVSYPRVFQKWKIRAIPFKPAFIKCRSNWLNNYLHVSQFWSALSCEHFRREISR